MGRSLGGESTYAPDTARIAMSGAGINTVRVGSYLVPVSRQPILCAARCAVEEWSAQELAMTDPAIVGLHTLYRKHA